MCQNAAMAGAGACDHCGGVLPGDGSPRRGRPRRWCSTDCRRAAWVRRHDRPAATGMTAQDAVAQVLDSPTATAELLAGLTARIEGGDEVASGVIAELVRAHRASVHAVARTNELRPFRR
ncbi:hypothetical protein KB201_17000 [Gordonia sp. SCSIO 19800]|nr:hypothetical protein [Gordonia sp. SCSIO 19800]